MTVYVEKVVKKLFVFQMICLNVFLINAHADNSDLNVCESFKNNGTYQCSVFTGDFWSQNSAQIACEEGDVSRGKPGNYEQFRCDPKPVKGVCFFNKDKNDEYARCGVDDSVLSCWWNGGQWSSNKELIENTCFPPAPNDKEIVNVSDSLEEILEYGEIFGACDKYFADVDNASRRQMLLCGKWMYFYEHFNFFGAPTQLFTFMQKVLPNTVGKGWEKMGMFTNPYDEQELPIGLADAPDFPGSKIPTVNWTCASCHFGQTPDGRFVVGQSNVNYEYGLQLLSIGLFPQMAAGQVNENEHAPEAIAAIQPMLDEWNSKPNYWELIKTLLPLLSLPQQTPMDIEQEKAFASWKAGVQDPVMFPNETNDDVHSPLKILSAYGIPTPAEFADAGHDPMSHVRIGWAGGMHDLYRFGRTFVALGTDDPQDWGDEKLKPLVEYMYSLKPPKNSESLSQSLIDQGEVLFKSKECSKCHNGPRYMSLDVFDFDEIGTDEAQKWYFDAEKDFGEPVPNIYPEEPLILTHSIKAPRLSGLWTQDKFLHNGSVDSLEDLFCIDHQRPTIMEEPYSDRGHMFTCDNLTRDEKLALIEFLKSI
ncbi:hypothetical protein [Pleionea sediminis]|uniref:hypothetical protein n=1 Tax=Pleionea sediminis TaxID=2569479 RepID=UPI001184AC05|nr:hypothetical protein [Pleionea sediminis]